ncbi:MAG: DUF6249 domain-containing protein [Candidatus Eisenbacteria bacterium]|nr:DUF6249 domain-containing protein [Candidatus Eisenbacteria bacterium]
MEIIVIPMVFGLAVVMVYVVSSAIAGTSKRRFLHRERIAALEKGVPLPDELLVETESAARRPGNHMTAIGGIIWTGFGLGVLISSKIIDTSGLGNDFHQFITFLSIWAVPALLIGLGLLFYAWLIRDRPGRIQGS